MTWRMLRTAASTEEKLRPYRRIGSALVSFYLCLPIVLAFIASSDWFLHWFVIPVFLCGVVIGTDFINWFRARLNIFAPTGILGLFGFHFFFLAPLLNVAWDYWLPRSRIIPPSDWRPWLGGMAILNLVGLLLYRFTRNLNTSSRRPRAKQVVWQVDDKLFPIVLISALLVTFSVQVAMYSQFGGIAGYIVIYESRIDAFSGMGWIFMISESFPILAFFGFAFYARRSAKARSWGVLLLALAVFFALKMLFGGFYGSRSNTIWGVFWAAGIIHFWVRPLTKKLVFAGLIFLIAFMYFYGFYKSAGLEGLRALESAEARVELENQTGRTPEALLLTDLARSDIQAFLLYRLWRPGSDYQYAWGRTYLGAAAILIPRSIWSDRPPHKVMEGTEAQYGRGSYIPGAKASSAVYGLAGEAMLNFGPLAVPFAFVVLGLLTRKVEHWLATWDAADVRLLLATFLVNLCFVVLVGDSDNILFFFIKNGAVPLSVIWMTSGKRVRIAPTGLEKEFSLSTNSLPTAETRKLGPR